MNIALVTITTQDYLPGCRAMINSFLKNNKDFNGDIVVFSCDKKIDIKLDYNKLKLIDISNTTYNTKNFNKQTYCTINNNYNANNRLEIFKLNYDCIIFADSDIIFRGNILNICKRNILSVVSTSQQHLKSIKVKKHFDAGLMFIGKKYLNGIFYKELHDFANSRKFRDDEEILNLFFKRKVNYLDKKYNILVHEINNENINDSIAIQYVGSRKPWHGLSIECCFDAFTIEEILRNNKNGLLLLKKLKTIYEKHKK